MDTSNSIVYFLRRATFFLKPYWKENLLSVIAITLSQLFILFFVLAPKYFVDAIQNEMDPNRMLLALGLLVGLLVISLMMTIVSDFFLSKAEDSLKKDLRLELFHHVQYLSAENISQAEAGKITSIFASELMAINDTLRSLIPDAFRAFLQLVFAIGAFFFLEWRLAVAVLLILPLTGIIPRKAIGKAAEADYKSKLSDAAVNSRVEDNIRSYKLIRAFGLQAKIRTEFADFLKGKQNSNPTWKDSIGSGLDLSFFRIRMVDTLTSLQQLTLNGIVFVIGAVLTFQKIITVSTFIVLVPLMTQIGSAIVNLSCFFGDLVSASSSMKRFDQVVAESDIVEEHDQLVPLPKISQNISIKGVNFRYLESQPVLDCVDLNIPVGSSVALVGRSGVGKTSLLRLLLRFNSPNHGSILVDGNQIDSIQHLDLHRHIGIVLQEDALLNASVRDNITLFDAEISEEDIVDAAKAVDAHDFIQNMAQGYDTVVGESGKFLSPGQRKRIEFARAIVRNPSILLLDEPTASLDHMAEATMINTIKELAKDRTVLIVTHRLSTIANVVDQICVLHDGCIVEKGLHAELLAQKGLYHQNWQLQNGFILSEDGLSAQVSPERLALIPLFEKLPKEALDKLSDEFKTEYYDSGRTVVAQGELANRFFIVVRGKLTVFASGC